MTEVEEALSERIRALHARIAHLCLEQGKGLDTSRMIEIYAGMVCELLLEYDLPGEMMAGLMDSLKSNLRLQDAALLDDAALSMPPIYVLDREIEFGRAFSREIVLEEWDDVHDALKILSNLIVYDFTIWEEQGLDRMENLSFFQECLRLALAFEFAAQDLCDMFIEDRIAYERWSLADCIKGLCATAGYQISQNEQEHKSHYLQPIEEAIFIMSQEALRLGVPGGHDWSKTLPVNDEMVSPPKTLIQESRPLCLRYMKFIKVKDPMISGAMIAKAAGRMLAVASGGDFPEIESVISKPMAMLALKHSFHHLEGKKVGSI